MRHVTQVFFGIALCCRCFSGAAAPSGNERAIAWANRLTWGVTAAPISGAETPGTTRWLTQQIKGAPGNLPTDVAKQIASLHISRLPMEQIVLEQDAGARAVAAIANPDQRAVAREAYYAQLSTFSDEARTRFILRALYSPSQLREQMTWFWFNHFNIQADKRDIRPMIANYEDVLRANAFGRFKDILESTLRHPAMLRYLDNDLNTVGHVNENYARELMELHTMGIGSGYTQKDIQELARILTGVGVNIDPINPIPNPRERKFYIRDGIFEFQPMRHDFGDKKFLGHVIRGSGFAEVETALQIMASSPATADRISTEIAKYFLGDEPPRYLINRMKITFEKSHGDIGEVIRTMVILADLDKPLDHAFKDPVHYVISAVRLAAGNQMVDVARVSNWITGLGERLYNHESPDGYDTSSTAWSGPGQMAARFDVARQIGGGAATLLDASAHAVPPQLRSSLYFNSLRHSLSSSTLAALDQASSSAEWNALFLSSPEFMHR